MIIRTNENVNNKQELQNLVVAIINRQTKSFTKDSCLKTINRYLRKSKFYNTREVGQVLDNCLDLYQRRNIVNCKNGVYNVNFVV